jgi:hypothetical protein
MKNYYIGIDGTLWREDSRHKFHKVKINAIFNPSQSITEGHALTIDGRIYNIECKNFVPIDYEVTSFSIHNGVYFIITPQRQFIQVGVVRIERHKKRIGRREPTNIRVMVTDLSHVRILDEECDYINSWLVIKGNEWIIHDLDRLANDREDEVSSHHNMPSFDQLIIARDGTIVTRSRIYQLVYRNIHLIDTPPNIIDAIQLTYSHINGHIMLLDSDGQLFIVKYKEGRWTNGKLIKCNNAIVNRLGAESKWSGFMPLDHDTHNTKKTTGVFNQYGVVYIINSDWFIFETDTPTEINLNRKKIKNARTIAHH